MAYLPPLHNLVLWLSILVVALAVLRGIPVLIEARCFFGPERKVGP